MNKYEIMVIIKSALENDKKEAMVEWVKEIITAEGGVVGKVDTWGNRKFAYPIKKQAEGYYVVINFDGKPDVPKELDRKLKISEDVLRHLIINKNQK